MHVTAYQLSEDAVKGVSSVFSCLHPTGLTRKRTCRHTTLPPPPQLGELSLLYTTKRKAIKLRGLESNPLHVYTEINSTVLNRIRSLGSVGQEHCRTAFPPTTMATGKEPLWESFRLKRCYMGREISTPINPGCMNKKCPASS